MALVDAASKPGKREKTRERTNLTALPEAARNGRPDNLNLTPKSYQWWTHLRSALILFRCTILEVIASSSTVKPAAAATTSPPPPKKMRRAQPLRRRRPRRTDRRMGNWTPTRRRLDLHLDLHLDLDLDLDALSKSRLATVPNTGTELTDPLSRELST